MKKIFISFRIFHTLIKTKALICEAGFKYHGKQVKMLLSGFYMSIRERVKCYIPLNLLFVHLCVFLKNRYLGPVEIG